MKKISILLFFAILWISPVLGQTVGGVVQFRWPSTYGGHTDVLLYNHAGMPGYDSTASLYYMRANFQRQITVTNTGTSGAATLIGGVLNIPNYSSSGGTWGTITGTLSSQTDLQTALNGKAPSFVGTGYSKFASGTLSYITAIPNTDLANSTISGISLGNSLFAHTPGYGLSGSNYSGGSAQTWILDTASSNAVVSKLRLATNLTGYQKLLTAGTGITITGNTISASGGGGGTWGSITGTLSSQTDLQAALNLKADLASPAFTGTPTAPTQTTTDATTALATDAFVQNNLTANTVYWSIGTFNGSGTSIAPYYLNVSGSPASGVNLPITSNGVYGALANYAPLNSPVFTGTPSLPIGATGVTQTVGDNTTALATDAFVLANSGGTTLYTGDGTLTANRTVTMGGKTLTFIDTSPSLTLANTSYPTSNRTWLGIVSPAYGVLVLGEGTGGYGEIASGSGLDIYMNNSNTPGTVVNGNHALGFISSGAAEFYHGLQITGGNLGMNSYGISGVSSLALTPVSGAAISITSAGTAFNYLTFNNGGGVNYFGTSTNTGTGFFSTSTSYEWVMSTGFAADIGFGTNLVEQLRIFNSTGHIATQNGGTYTDKKAQFQTTSFSTNITTSNKTAAYTIATSDYAVTCDASSAAFTATLPTAVGAAGQIYLIKKVDSSGNAITVGTTSSQTIDGSTTYSLATQYKYVMVQSNNANWIVIANN